MESSHSVSRRRQTAPEPRGSKFQILESWCKRGQRKVTRLAGMGKTVRGVLQRRDGSGSQRYERAVLNAGCVAPRREVGAISSRGSLLARAPLDVLCRRVAACTAETDGILAARGVPSSRFGLVNRAAR